jgi:hypothetical protein
MRNGEPNAGSWIRDSAALPVQMTGGGFNNIGSFQENHGAAGWPEIVRSGAKSHDFVNPQATGTIN